MADESNANPVDPTAEEKYWRENLDTQLHAREGTTYEHFAPAYRVGAEATTKYPAKHEIGSALPWDHVRGASKAAWMKVHGLVSPRDPSRGMCGSI